ncbi:hypothetical protein AAVH_39537 [Aphelenchoides avenae]|nr:hypothetical protein AAVH_39537 [Aphelenchus avenae]
MNSMCRILAAAFMLASSAVLAAPMIGSKYTLVLPSHLPNAVKFHEWTSMARETRDAEPESDNAILMTGEAEEVLPTPSYHRPSRRVSELFGKRKRSAPSGLRAAQTLERLPMPVYYLISRQMRAVKRAHQEQLQAYIRF